MTETPKWFKATPAQVKDFFKWDKSGKQGINNVDEDTVMDQDNYTSNDWEKYLKGLPKVDKFYQDPLYPRCTPGPVIVDEPPANTNWKPSNPKDLMGIRKVSLCTVSGPVLYEVALGMQEGGMKYGRHNYRSEGVAASTYIDAGMRHLWEYWEGEDIDPESGVHHISKAISTLFVLRDAILNSKCTDDRPIRPENPEWLKGMNAQASALVDKYPQPEKPYTHKPLPER